MSRYGTSAGARPRGRVDSRRPSGHPARVTSPHLSREDLGDEIRKRRKERKLRQTDLAETAAVAARLVGAAERGEPVSATTLRAIARALDLPADMVRGYVDDEPNTSLAEPMPQDYPDEHEYMNAVYWYLRQWMSHDAVMRGFHMAAAIYERKNTERSAPKAPGNKVG